MIELILSLLAFLLPLIVEGVQAAVNRQSGANHEANINEFRKTLVNDNTDDRSVLLADQHDRVLKAVRGG